MLRTNRFSAVLLALLLVSPVASATNHNESTDGDFSDDRLNPSVLALQVGHNVITGTSGIIPGTADVDREYIHVTIPVGAQLTAIVMNDFISDDDGIAFLGVQAGTTFTLPPEMDFSQVGGLLGWTHFGPVNDDQPGDDLLERIGQGSGAMGFTPPLPAGDYTFWLQQRDVQIGYELDFVVAIPEPATLALALPSLALVLRRRLVAA